MSIFDAYVTKMAEYLEEMKTGGRRIKEASHRTEVSQLLEGLPIRVGPEASPGIILRGDTFIELGNPEAGSAAFVLWTDNPSLIRDGRITLIGPDIQESPGASLPFGQVLLVAGEGLGEAEHQVLEQSQYVADQIEGYMIRSSSQHMWSRVSKDAAAKGFSFETLGRALMAIFKTGVPKVQAVEVVFVTSSKEDVQRLDSIAVQIRKIAKDIVAKVWKAKGFDIMECTFGWDCSSCPDQPVCDDIREIITVRKQKAKKAEEAA
ncbi:MAG: carbon monoxide dehydrogenase [Chloroflexi bacterium]|nr:carbon monoxide dehydrogenase [Chloroflexota bacterium]